MDTRSDFSELMTAEQLAALPHDGGRYELVEGELRMMSPAGGRHGRVAAQLAFLLSCHVQSHGLGVVYAAETGFILGRNPDTVRAPDVAFVSKSRLSQIQDDKGFVPLAPDIVGEVISPTDSFSEVQDKALAWLAAGTRLVLLVDPEARQLHALRSVENRIVLSPQDEMDAADVLPGWRFCVTDLFV
jgi:Uma2 family endonuclease